MPSQKLTLLTHRKNTGRPKWTFFPHPKTWVQRELCCTCSSFFPRLLKSISGSVCGLQVSSKKPPATVQPPLFRPSQPKSNHLFSMDSRPSHPKISQKLWKSGLRTKKRQHKIATDHSLISFMPKWRNRPMPPQSVDDILQTHVFSSF